MEAKKFFKSVVDSVVETFKQSSERDGCTPAGYKKVLPKSQTEQIKEHLESGKSITPLDALRLYGCFRLGARIFDLRDSGMEILTNMITKDGKTFAEYSLK